MFNTDCLERKQTRCSCSCHNGPILVALNPALIRFFFYPEQCFFLTNSSRFIQIHPDSSKRTGPMVPFPNFNTKTKPALTGIAVTNTLKRMHQTRRISSSWHNGAFPRHQYEKEIYITGIDMRQHTCRPPITYEKNAADSSSYSVFNC